MSQEMRGNIRASLNATVVIQGTDRSGKSFKIQGEGVDFSRKGLGLLIPENVVTPGSVVSITVPKKLRTDAIVQWTRQDAETGKVRVGVCMINPQVRTGLRIVASILLCVALLGQISFARSRGPQANKSCNMGLAQMKNILESKLGPWIPATENEKVFLHTQHQRMSCKEYTREYEKSNFYADKNKRDAVSRFHWNEYHSKDSAARASVVSGLDAAFATGTD
jgi:hypothetical protein